MTPSEPRRLRYPPDLWTQALRIARQLGETQPSPRFQIAEIIRQCGLDLAQSLVQEMQAVEALGGMLVPDGSRRRTPGGVFFALARNQMTEEQRQAVFTRPPAPRFRWTKRQDILAPLLADPGAVESVQVVLEGRPDEVCEYDGVMFLKMARSGVNPPTPKGVPQPQLLPALYTVLIRPEQWRKVASKLDKPQAMLVVEGTCAVDAEIGGLVVYASKVTVARRNK